MLVKSRPKYITLGLLGAMMALLIVGLMYSQGTARAQGVGDSVSTGTTIVPTGQAPVFECSWQLPDMLPLVDNSGILGGPAVPDGAIQYDTVIGLGNHDDDAALPTTTPACDGPPATLPMQPQGVMEMITVMPRAHVSPLVPVPERWIQLWAAVDHPNGIQNIDDVYWKIFHPDGTFKIQVHGTKIGDRDADKPSPGVFNNGTTSGDSMAGYDHDNDVEFGTVGFGPAARRIEECRQLGQYNTAGSMFEAAYHTGQVSSTAISDVDKGIVAKCQENEKAVYYAKFAVHKDQPCGKYKIDAYAIANGNETNPPLTTYIRIVCFWYLNTDFNGLSWGAITPGNMQVISGDLIWDAGGVATPNSNGPTVHNGGNHPMGIRIHFSTMWQDVAFGPKKIDKFDACFGKTPATIECVGQDFDNLDIFGIPVDAIMASQWVGFGPQTPAPADRWHGDFDQVLCANDLGKLDLSIHPYANLPAGSYSGTFDIMGHTVHDLDFNPCYQDQEGLWPGGRHGP